MTWTPPSADEWLNKKGLTVIWADPDGFDEAIQPPVLMLRARATPREQRWYTFHAIAHMELHCGNQLWQAKFGDSGAVNKQERQAETWVADLLIPSGYLIEAINAGADYGELADTFEVPLDRVQFAINLLERRGAA